MGRVLGLAGGPHVLGEDPASFPHIDGYWHDAAAALVVDGDVVVANEEERLVRAKHTPCFPQRAVEACLRGGGCAADELDAVAVYFTEDYWRAFVDERLLYDPTVGLAEPRAHIQQLVAAAELGTPAAEKIHFVPHHTAHTTAAWHHSGFARSLVLTLDGAGEEDSGLVATADDTGLHPWRTIDKAQSLGGLYLWMTRFLGFKQFDEYKVMGLAAQGARGALGRRLEMVRLQPGGRFEIDWRFTLRLRALARPRRQDEPIVELHADLAAAVQEALEDCVLHLLRAAQERTREERLCMAGGVAHNCSLNGVIARAGRFADVFVHPASDDAGCAIGAALAVDPPRSPRRLQSVAWGSTVGADDLADAVRRWCPRVRVDAGSMIEWSARHLAADGLLPWVQGRAEFGPRALGGRSLLADPRSAAMRQRINDLVKHRESFRPFAPVVRREDAEDLFEIPPGIDCSFMSFAVRVRPSAAPRLQAVTHVDGTARLQTVTREQNPRLWELLGAFGELTGTPVLLNTSLNVAGEPIVDSVDDLIDFLHAADLRSAVVDDAIVTCLPPDPSTLVPHLHADVRMERRSHPEPGTWFVERSGPTRPRWRISPCTATVLLEGDPTLSLGDRVRRASRRPGEQQRTVTEIDDLWRRRALRMMPVAQHRDCEDHHA